MDDLKYVAIIEGIEFEAERVDDIMKIIFELDPELSMALRCAMRWEEKEANL